MLHGDEVDMMQTESNGEKQAKMRCCVKTALACQFFEYVFVNHL